MTHDGSLPAAIVPKKNARDISTQTHPLLLDLYVKRSNIQNEVSIFNEIILLLLPELLGPNVGEKIGEQIFSDKLNKQFVNN